MPLLGSLSSIDGEASAQFVYVTESAQTIDEGTSVTFTINSIGIADGTTLYYTSTGTVSSADLSSGSLSGSVVLGGSSNTVAMTFSNDLTTEGNETVQLQVRTGSTSGPIVAESQVVTIIDTSAAPYGSVVFVGQTTGVGSAGLSSTKYWTVPDGVTSISLVAVGVGAPGSYTDTFLVGSGGGGGALSYRNNYSVTPGQQLTINLGWSPQGASYQQGGNTWVTTAAGSFIVGAQAGKMLYMGSGGTRNGTSNTEPAYRMTSTSGFVTGSGFNTASHGGGQGGLGGSGSGASFRGGGGGAGGFTGAGGNGGTSGGAGTSGAAGGGGGGGCATTGAGGAGGGTTLLGSSVAGGTGGAQGGNGTRGGGGTAVANGIGSYYGGGGGSAPTQSTWPDRTVAGLGGRSAVRIVFPGLSRQFPDTDVANTANTSNP